MNFSSIGKRNKYYTLEAFFEIRVNEINFLSKLLLYPKHFDRRLQVYFIQQNIVNNTFFSFKPT